MGPNKMAPAMSSCCTVKCLFIFFNLIFLASGVAIVAIGVQQYTTYQHLGMFAGKSLSNIAIVLIAVDVTIALVSLFGLCGAIFNSSTMMFWFICILVVIIIFEVATGAVICLFGSKKSLVHMSNAISAKARKVVNEYSPERRHAIDKIQEKFKCCGADSSEDWSTSTGWANAEAVPDSCCMEKAAECGKEKEKAQKKGCISAIQDFLLTNLLWVGPVCVALAILGVFGIGVGCLMSQEMNRKNYEDLG